MGDVKFLKLITSIEKTLISKAMKEKQLFFFFFLQFWNSKPLTLCFYSLWSMQTIPKPVSEEVLSFPIFLLCSSYAFGLEILFHTLSLSLCLSVFLKSSSSFMTSGCSHITKPFLSSSIKDPHGSDPATQGRVLCREYLCVFYLHQHIKQEVKELLLPFCASRLLTWCHQHHSHQLL